MSVKLRSRCVIFFHMNFFSPFNINYSRADPDREIFSIFRQSPNSQGKETILMSSPSKTLKLSSLFICLGSLSTAVKLISSSYKLLQSQIFSGSSFKFGLLDNLRILSISRVPIFSEIISSRLFSKLRYFTFCMFSQTLGIYLITFPPKL